MAHSEGRSSETSAAVVGEGLTLRERQWAFATHLAALAGLLIPGANIVVPLILWRIHKSQTPFVDRQGKEVVNFQITATLALIVVAAIVDAYDIVQLMYLWVLIIVGAVILTIRGAIAARNGEAYRYPVTWDFVGFIASIRGGGGFGSPPGSSHSGRGGSSFRG